MPSEFLVVAEKVLTATRRPMSAAEIVSHAIENGLFTDRISGQTPHQTLKSKLSVDIRTHGKESLFVRVAPGKFLLRRLIDVPASIDSQIAADPTIRHQIYQAPRYEKPPPREQVLVFPTSLLEAYGRFQGVTKSWRKFYREIAKPDSCYYMDRLEAEHDNDHKQVLTYVMVTRRGRLLAYKRGIFNRVEDFLKGADCIGFGGHVTASDLNLLSEPDRGIIECSRRELLEELILPRADLRRLPTSGPRIVGMLNDDSSAVGRRHFAFILKYEVSPSLEWRRPARGEKSITQLRWLGEERAPPPIWQFEYWSQLCLREFFPKVASTTTAYVIRRRKNLQHPDVLCVCGPVGSGKSEATRLLCASHGYTEINTGKLVAELLGVPPVPVTPRREFQEMAWSFIQHPDGPSRLVDGIQRAAGRMRDMRIVVDGVRQQSTLNELKRRFARVGVIYVHTLPDLASRFLSEGERNMSLNEFLAARAAPVEAEVEGLIGQSDAVIYNWRGIRQYRATLNALLNSLEIVR